MMDGQPLRDIEPFRAMAVLAEARALEAAGRPIIHWELGEPALIAPESVRNAVTEAWRAAIPAIRRRLGRPLAARSHCRFYQRRYGLTIDPARNCRDHRVIRGFRAQLSRLLLRQKHAIAIPNPGYPAYRNICAGLILNPSPSRPARRMVS